MQWNLGVGMGRMTNQLIRQHPMAYDVQVLRKLITRPDETGVMGGIPNFGGVGSLDSQDESQYKYEFLCNAHAVKGTTYSPGNMTDNLDAPVGSDEEFTYLMVGAKVKEHPEWVDTEFKTKDVVLFVFGADENSARAAYEVASVDATCQLPPFMPRYVLNRRADLDLPANFDENAPFEEPATPGDTTPAEPADTPAGNSVASGENDLNSIGVLSD